MKFLKVISIYFLVSMCVFGCATNSQHLWKVKTGDRATLAFTGKGLAAGLMMDAYLAGAGIAIGIAIDEGIAKELSSNLTSQYRDFTIVSLFEAALLKNSPRRSPVSTAYLTNVTIETYGFHTFPSDGDKVTAWLKVRFTSGDKETIINYPADFSPLKSAELSELKANPLLAYDFLNDAVVRVSQSYIASQFTR